MDGGNGGVIAKVYDERCECVRRIEYRVVHQKVVGGAPFWQCRESRELR
jgi:hypothetical protein